MTRDELIMQISALEPGFEAEPDQTEGYLERYLRHLRTQVKMRKRLEAESE